MLYSRVTRVQNYEVTWIILLVQRFDVGEGDIGSGRQVSVSLRDAVGPEVVAKHW